MPIPVLSIVVPCYNEQDAIRTTCSALRSVLESMVACGLVASSSYILFVDDGSRDRTWEIVGSLRNESGREHREVAGIRLAANAGHQSALLAGMQAAVGCSDIIITIDADLQDDPSAIPDMVRQCNSGCEVVLGVRRSRAADSWFKRSTARGFYKLMTMMGVRLVEDHADFRALTKSAALRLLDHPERNLFLRGLVTSLSSRTAIVHYDRAARVAGESKYPLRKMLAFAWRGITANSTAPLRAIFAVGILSIFLSIVGVAWAGWGYLSGSTVPGWLSTVIPQFLIAGLIMLSQAVFGEYLARIYIEVKRRPHCFIAEAVGINLPPTATIGQVHGL